MRDENAAQFPERVGGTSTYLHQGLQVDIVMIWMAILILIEADRVVQKYRSREETPVICKNST